MNRNYEISKGIYNKDKTKKFIDDIINARNQEQDCSFYGDEKSIEMKSISISHFTSPGIMELFKHIEKLDNTTLNEKEINEITQICVEKGMCKIILTLVEANNKILHQINTVFSLCKNDSLKNNFLSTVYTEKYSDNFFKQLKEIVGNDWLDNFKKKSL